MSALSRRTWLLAAALLLLGGSALAGSYLSQAAVLVRGAEAEAGALARRPTDRKLASLAHRLAAARVEAARAIEVPKEVVPAHPHLLLLLELHERAAEAAARGEQERFLVELARAREERRTFEAVLGQLGWRLPEN
jgi:hypothetical protein